MKLSIDRLIKLIPEWNGKLIKVNPINSGITNINFEVTVGKKSYFLSMPDSNSELLNIDYGNKYYNNKICGEINISPRVTHFIESDLESFSINLSRFYALYESRYSGMRKESRDFVKKYYSWDVIAKTFYQNLKSIESKKK